MEKQFQSKMISDDQIVLAIKSLLRYCPGGVPGAAVAPLFPNVPSKVIAAKLRQSVLKGLLAGCSSDSCARRGTCLLGCPLGFTLPEVE